MNNKNTTIDKVALELFGKHYHELPTKEHLQWCHSEMTNNPKWLAPFWKQEGYQSEVDSWGY